MSGISTFLKAAAYDDGKKGKKYSRDMAWEYLELMPDKDFQKLCKELEKAIDPETTDLKRKSYAGRKPIDQECIWNNYQMKEAYIAGQNNTDNTASTWYANYYHQHTGK